MISFMCNFPRFEMSRQEFVSSKSVFAPLLGRICSAAPHALHFVAFCGFLAGTAFCDESVLDASWTAMPVLETSGFTRSDPAGINRKILIDVMQGGAMLRDADNLAGIPSAALTSLNEPVIRQLRYSFEEVSEKNRLSEAKDAAIRQLDRTVVKDISMEAKGGQIREFAVGRVLNDAKGSILEMEAGQVLTLPPGLVEQGSPARPVVDSMSVVKFPKE